MFAPISAILGLLFLASTLPNGIRLVELPAEGDAVQIVAGYTKGGLSTLSSSSGAKSLVFDAYATGGKIEWIEEIDRTGLRLTVPQWALPMLVNDLPALFKEVPKGEEGTGASSPDFREKIEEEIRGALLPSASAASVDFATEDAFILISAPIPGSLRDALAAIPKRGVAQSRDEVSARLPAERTLRFKSELPTGGVVFASPTPGVFYKQWYLILMLDRLIHRAVPLPLETRLPLTVRPYYYRLELPVPAGQFPEPAEENLLQELQRLQFTPANTSDLSAARQDALSYLDRKEVREWFASHDLVDRRNEGVQWVESMTSEDMRIAARDLLIMNRVIATWSPKPRQTSVAVESMNPAGGAPGEAQARQRAASNDEAQARQRAASNGDRPYREATGVPPVMPFPLHQDSHATIPLPERLASGVSISSSTINAVFISGGPFTRFDHEPAADDLKPFQKYRAERILVLAPASSMAGARQLWSSFKGAASGETGVSKGKVSSGDLPALFILKTLLDLKLIESGGWREAELRIDASDGSALQIIGGDDRRAQILEWIHSLAAMPPTDSYFNWAREVALHRFETIQPDLQALTWERDPQGSIQDLQTVSSQHVEDVARIYF